MGFLGACGRGVIDGGPTPLAEREQRLLPAGTQAIGDQRRARETSREAVGDTDEAALLSPLRRACDDGARHEHRLLHLDSGSTATVRARADARRLRGARGT